MANDSAKRVVKKNNKILTAVRIALIGSLVVYLLLLYIYKSKTTGIFIGISMAHYSLAVLIYQMFQYLSKGRYDSTGRLIDGGSELSGVVVNVAFDVLYVSLLVFMLSPITVKIYWLDLLISISIFYGFWSIVIKPMMHLTDIDTAVPAKTSQTAYREKKRYKY